jgi:hypothetical protein
MDYDYARYEKILVDMLEGSHRDHDDLEIGRDISDLPEVKIIFDGYGDLEDEDENGEYRYTEGGNKNMESYAIFIHKDALVEDFIFPPHDVFGFTFGSMIQHRPVEEVCIYAWFDVVDNSWEINQLEDQMSDDHEMNEDDVMEILEGLYELYFKPWEGTFENDPITGIPKWPFPTKD